MSGAPRSARERLAAVLVILLPALLGAAVHARGIGNGFLADDFFLILDNPQVSGASSWTRLLASDWFESGQRTGIGYWRPVVKASFRGTWAAAGGPNPRAFHAGNVALHAAAAASLSALLLALAGPAVALTGASLWAVHPMTVQAVQNVTARSDVAAALFVLAALALHAAWVRRGGGTLLVAGAAAAALALGSKESALLLVPAALALALALGAPLRRALAGVAPIAAVTIGLTIARMAVAGVSPRPNALGALGLGGKALCVLEAVGSYLPSLLLGRRIVRLPQVPPGPLDFGVLLGAVVLLGAAVVLVRSRLRGPVSFLVVLCGASLAPALAVWLIHIPMWRGEVPVAERWLYLPAAGACGLAALLLSRVPRRAGPALAGLLVLALATVSWGEIPAYASPDAWNEAIADEFLSRPPRNPREAYLAMVFRAARRADAGDAADARRELLAAEALAPALPEALWQRAVLELRSGDGRGAEQLARRLLSSGYAADPALLRQRAEMGNDTLGRLPRRQLLLLLARSLAAQGRNSEARTVLGEAAPLFASSWDRADYLRVCGLVGIVPAS